MPTIKRWFEPVLCFALSAVLMYAGNVHPVAVFMAGSFFARGWMLSLGYKQP